MGSAWWGADSLSDTIRIQFHSGFSGSTFVLALPSRGTIGDTIRGRAFELWDFGPGHTLRGKAFAARVRC
jgi:hypothetical protein